MDLEIGNEELNPAVFREFVPVCWNILIFNGAMFDSRPIKFDFRPTRRPVQLLRLLIMRPWQLGKLNFSNFRDPINSVSGLGVCRHFFILISPSCELTPAKCAQAIINFGKFSDVVKADSLLHFSPPQIYSNNNCCGDKFCERGGVCTSGPLVG